MNACFHSTTEVRSTNWVGVQKEPQALAKNHVKTQVFIDLEDLRNFSFNTTATTEFSIISNAFKSQSDLFIGWVDKNPSKLFVAIHILAQYHGQLTASMPIT